MTRSIDRPVSRARTRDSRGTTMLPRKPERSIILENARRSIDFDFMGSQQDLRNLYFAMEIVRLIFHVSRGSEKLRIGCGIVLKMKYWEQGNFMCIIWGIEFLGDNSGEIYGSDVESSVCIERTFKECNFNLIWEIIVVLFYDGNLFLTVVGLFK